MNAECLRITRDRRLWELLMVTRHIIAEILDMDADDLLKKVLTNPQAEQLILNRFSENSLKEAG